jgi:hypothetical protein
MYELSTKAKKAVRYEPIERRRRKDRRVNESDRRSEVRNEGQGDRRKNTDRRDK